MEISEKKSKLRKEIRTKIRDWISLNDLESVSKSLCDKILSLDEYKNSDVVLAYIPMKNEAGCVPAVLDALGKGKVAAVPKCFPETSGMDFYVLKNELPLESQLECGSYGIREPRNFLERIDFDNSADYEDKNPGKTKKIPMNARIFVIVPGLAFSKDGKRLGKGKGFYDRFFEKLEKNGYKNIFLCGLCLPCQISSDVPCGEFDREVDLVLF